MQREPYIPHSPERLRQAYRQCSDTYKSQEALSKAVTHEMHQLTAPMMHQSRLSELLSGGKPISVVELLVMAKMLCISPHELLRSELQHYCLEGEGVSVKNLHTEVESDIYLTKLESDGRILAFSQFPSYLFYTNRQPLRQKQFNLLSFENREYYTLDSYINFLFSVSSRFSLLERIEILSRYIDYFNPSKKGNLHKKHIVFFSRHAFLTLGRFTNMEFFPKKGLIIVLAPILQEGDGDIFLEIRNSELCSQVTKFYTETIEPFSNPRNLLLAGRRTLQHRLEGKSIEESIHFFYQECLVSMPDSPDPINILENFSPEVREMLTQK